MPVLPAPNQVGAIQYISPPWLLEDNNREYMQAMGEEEDELISKVRQAVRARMPGVGTPTALKYTGQDRVMPQGADESDADYAQRLKTSFETWQRAGTPRGLMSQCLIYLGSKLAKPSAQTPLCVEVSDSGDSAWTVWDTYYSNSDISKQPAHVRHAPNWQWDGNVYWWRVWLIFFAGPGSAIKPNANKWGSGGKWGHGTWGNAGALTSWGFDNGPQLFFGIRAILRLWKTANAWYPWVIFSFNPGTGAAGSEFSPNSSPGAGNPDNTWGRWSKIVGGTYVASRASDSRYTDGAF